jgi:hypothetical protein
VGEGGQHGHPQRGGRRDGQQARDRARAAGAAGDEESKRQRGCERQRQAQVEERVARVVVPGFHAVQGGVAAAGDVVEDEVEERDLRKREGGLMRVSPLASPHTQTKTNTLTVHFPYSTRSMTTNGASVATKKPAASANERPRRGAASTPSAAGTNATPATGQPHTRPTAAHPMTAVTDPAGLSQAAEAAVRQIMTNDDGNSAGAAAKRPAHGSATASAARAVARVARGFNEGGLGGGGGCGQKGARGVESGGAGNGNRRGTRDGGVEQQVDVGAQREFGGILPRLHAGAEEEVVQRFPVVVDLRVMGKRVGRGRPPKSKTSTAASPHTLPPSLSPHHNRAQCSSGRPPSGRPAAG